MRPFALLETVPDISIPLSPVFVIANKPLESYSVLSKLPEITIPPALFSIFTLPLFVTFPAIVIPSLPLLVISNLLLLSIIPVESIVTPEPRLLINNPSSSSFPRFITEPEIFTAPFVLLIVVLPPALETIPVIFTPLEPLFVISISPFLAIFFTVPPMLVPPFCP